MEAEHTRSRERFPALLMIASGQKTACGWAREIGRTKETVLKWMHDYDRFGPETVFYRHTGGRQPFIAASKTGNS